LPTKHKHNIPSISRSDLVSPTCPALTITSSSPSTRPSPLGAFPTPSLAVPLGPIARLTSTTHRRYEGRWHVQPADFDAAERKSVDDGVEFTLLAKEVHGTFAGTDEETGKTATLTVKLAAGKFSIAKAEH